MSVASEIQVHLHAPSIGTLKTSPVHVSDITPFVQSLEWSSSINAPYETISLQLKVPKNALKAIPINSGAWVIIRVPSLVDPPLMPRTEAFGYVTSISIDQSVDQVTGTINTSGIQVNCIGWFDLLNNIQMATGHFLGSYDRGTLLNTRFYSYLLESAMESASFDGTVGSALEIMWPALARVAMPMSLTGLTKPILMGEIIPVVHDNITAEYNCGSPSGARTPRYNIAAGVRQADPIPGPTITALTSTLGGGGGQTVMSLIQGSFMGDPALMELFPSLEDFGAQPWNTTYTKGEPPDDLIPKDENGVPNFAASAFAIMPKAKLGVGVRGPGNLTNQGGINPTVVPSVAKGMPSDPLGVYLGRSPVLMYRMKPFRTEPLRGFATARMKSPHAALFLLETMFNSPTWLPMTAHSIPTTEITRFGLFQTDQNISTAFTCSPPLTSGNPLKYMSRAGLPVIPDFAKLYYRGFKEHEVSWPFLPDQEHIENMAAAGNPNGYMGYAYTLAMQAAQFGAPEFQMFSGQVELSFRTDIRHGQMIKIGLEAGLGNPWVGLTGEDWMYAYCEKVTHRVTVDPVTGTTTARTVVDFTRGLFTELLRNYPLTKPEAIMLDAMASAEIGSWGS